MRIWILERTDFLATTERRLGWVSTAVAAGALFAGALALSVAVAAYAFMTAMDAVGAFYGMAVAPPYPDGLSSLLMVAALCILGAFAGAGFAALVLLLARPGVAGLLRETRPLRYLRPESVTEIALPVGDAR